MPENMYIEVSRARFVFPSSHHPRSVLSSSHDHDLQIGKSARSTRCRQGEDVNARCDISLLIRGFCRLARRARVGSASPQGERTILMERYEIWAGNGCGARGEEAGGQQVVRAEEWLALPCVFDFLFA